MDVQEFLDYSYMMQNKHKEKDRLLQSEDLREIKIAVLCGSTFGEIQDFLEIFLLHYGLKPCFYIGEYNRFFEEACFPNTELKEFEPEIILIHVTNKNLFYQLQTYEVSEQALVEDKYRFTQIWQSLEEQYHCTIIQNNFEYFLYRMIGNAARTHKDGSINYIDKLNRFIAAYMQEHQHLYINDIHFLSARVGLLKWYDDRMWSMYKYPMAMSVMPQYALNIANIIKSVLGRNRKTIITDLDNTLWGDVIGEVGADNIKLGSENPQGESYALLQWYLKYLSKHGVLLNICSKNEYETGMSGIRSPKSILSEDDFVVNKINWNEKYVNINEILNDLNLLEDSAVFMDDNQMECDSVKAMLPGIEVLQVKNIGQFLNKMEELSFFEISAETKEDEQRNQYYKNNVARSEAQKHYQNYDEYLKSLNMVCYVDQVYEGNIDRIVQLFNKTNQFNFLTKRYTREAIETLVRMPDIIIPVLELEDKFGSNGIVSVAVIRFGHADVYIDGWIMSCRVFGRGLEFAMLKLICELCRRKEINILHGYYRQTAKNTKISSFFQKLGFQKGNFKQETGTQEWICRDINRLWETCTTDNIIIRYIENRIIGSYD